MTTLRGCTLTFVLAALGGCGGYNPPGLASMSAADLCEVQNMQRGNLSESARQTIQSELARRNDSCANHAAEVAQRYEAFMWRETYGKNDNP